jgi:hypothetical protein
MVGLSFFLIHNLQSLALFERVLRSDPEGDDAAGGVA